jgi:hypothetical protein
VSCVCRKKEANYNNLLVSKMQCDVVCCPVLQNPPYEVQVLTRPALGKRFIQLVTFLLVVTDIFSVVRVSGF